MKLTKQEYYEIRSQTYDFVDPEANIRYQNIIEWIEPKKDLTVYEVGCKFAVLRDILANKEPSATYVGVDIDLGTLQKIPNYNEETFKVHNVNQGLPFEDNSADYLVCLEVMEHLENATFFIEEAFRVLRPDGRLILSVPNPYCWNEVVGNLLQKKDTEGHIASFTNQNLNALLTFAGLQIIDRKGSFTRVPLSKKIFRKTIIFKSNNTFLTRGFMYLIGK